MTNDVNDYAIIDKNTNRFAFDNYFLIDGAVINFSLYEDEKVVPKVNPIVTTVNGKRDLVHPFPIQNITLKSISRESDLRNTFESYNIEKLDTVNLSFIKQKQIEKPLKHEKSYIANKYSKGIKIDSMARRIYGSVLDVIEANGFAVQRVTSGNSRTGAGRVRIKNRNPVTFIASNEPLLIIDDVALGNDYNILTGMTLEDIDEMFVDTNGNGYGARGGAGVIRIYRKNGVDSLGKIKSRNYGDVEIKDGFSIEKKFYSPEYYYKSEEVLKEFACLNWKSDITTNDLGMYSYKMKDFGLSTVVLVIQGFTNSGELISEITPINVDKNQ